MKNKIVLMLVLGLLNISTYVSGAIKPESIAPNFSLKQLDGKEAEIYSLINKGNVVVLAFFTTWCKPCKEEFPQLNILAKKYANQPVKIFLVRSDYVNKAAMEQFVAENKIDVPILIDEKKSLDKGTVSNAYGVSQFPTLAIIGKDFRVKYITEEAQKNLVENVSAKIDELSKESTKVCALALVFTGNTNGKIYPWQDSYGSYGGIARKAEYFKRFKVFYPYALFMDSGDFMPARSDITAAKHMFRMIGALNYDALAIGDQEAAKGIDFLLGQAEENKLPFVGSNIELNSAAKAVVIPYKIVKAGGCNVAVLSANKESTFMVYPEEIKGKIKINPEVETLSKLVQELKSKADIIVLISHCGHSQDRVIAQSVPGIDIIVGGHDQTLLKQSIKIGNTTIIQAGKDGEYIGKYIMLVNDKKEIVYSEYNLVQMGQDIPEDADMLKLMKSFDSQKTGN